MADFPFIGPRCHEACSVDCAECFRARSESMGNEFDRDTGPSPLGMKVVPRVAGAILILVIVGIATPLFR